ncbi:hypothetical protein [Alicyclobacillus ferrooxydans]|uniref:Uncharacterized protein n=1 Tax=Alicyclobacillus ferrooxydans TaxID=471514 RepID=A0A0P9CI34_9BACL|nr:hypothetical protein [Alicyclobacillus ferrooxydans]KPV42706.1 hypothetical protein AN477_16385 [Alicyclobacillus ferrooxydans]
MPSLKVMGGIVAASIAALFVPMFAVVAGLVPSGNTNLQALYQKEAAQDSYDPLTKRSYLNWADVYMYDYIQYHNNFSKVTPASIHATDRLFIYYITEKRKVPVHNPKTGKIIRYATVTYHEPRAYSLLDVMNKHGYSTKDYDMALSIEQDLIGSGGNMPVGDVTVPELRYKAVNPVQLYNYVHARQSLFTLQDMQNLELAAKTYDVNPVLLLAITGQECSFDPVWIDHAAERHNNPWDVFHSYADYNTTFSDSANIAANTLRHKLSTPPPPGEDAIQWCNDPSNPWGAYAQDSQWAYGVEDIFANIEAYIGTPLTPSSLN